MSVTARNIVLTNQRTDNANATSFIDCNGDNFRFCFTWQKWLAWDGRKWCLESGHDRIMKAARVFAQGLWDSVKPIMGDDELGDGIKKQIVSFARQSNDKRRIENMVALATHDSRVTIHHNDLDADAYLFNCQNGTLDLKSQTFRKHQREDLITQMAGVNFDKKAQCPTFAETLRLVFDGNEKLEQYVQVLFGYGIAGITDEHILPVCYGEGCNGKSTIWNAIMEIMGDYGSLANQDLLLSNKHQGHPTEVAALFGKRFVAISEPEQGRSLNESRVKELTGDKTVTARRMREDFWEFPPSHTFWMSTNHKPEISGGDEGIWRRIKLIPFTVDLRKVTDVDPRIHEKLETELSGILNWMLAGWKLYQAKGLSSFEPNEVKAATQEYRDNEDEVGCFLREAYVENPAFVIGATDAFKAYQDFGGKMTQTKFGTAMAKRFKKRRHTTGRYKNKIVYEGIGDSEM